jgi:HD-GYP domain-containing protein (c-di-GMP phosphodiesterase class II)/DNA-binding CsgD family transcriptional regulator
MPQRARGDRGSRATAASGIRLAELLAAISLSTDLGRGFPPEKTLRTCLIALRIAGELGLDENAKSDTYYAALIHAVGCTAFTHESARTFGTNELVFFPASAKADPTSASEGMRAMRAQVSGDRVVVRARATFKSMTAGKSFMSFAARADCEAGMRFAERVGLGRDVGRIAGQVIWERWDGKGVSDDLSGDKLEIGARIIAVANQIEIFCRTDGPDEARTMLQRRAGGWFDPAVVRAAERIADDILGAVDAGSVWDVVLDAEPAPRITIGERRVDDVATALADMIDVKSPYLLGHSRGVAHLGEGAASHLAMSTDECTAIRRAGLVHDLGRVGVPNRIWDKPGPLTVAEWEQVRLHAYNTERILARSPVLSTYAQLAGMHHERSDGSGYHRGSTAATIPIGARLLAAADVFQALTEPRPHRAASTRDEAAAEVAAMAGAGTLDPDATDAVCAAAGVVSRRRRRTSGGRPAGLTEREVEVLRLLARGLTKKEIAKALTIAHGTVHTHTVHIYEKVGASTRAGVALFAMEHGLVRD